MLITEHDEARSIEGRAAILDAMALSIACARPHDLAPGQAETAPAPAAQGPGEMYSEQSRPEHNTAPRSREQRANILVETERRTDGCFRIAELHESRIMLRNAKCRIGIGAPSRTELCRMTAGVRCRIASEKLRCARDDMRPSIGRGGHERRVLTRPLRDGAGNTDFDEIQVEPIAHFGSGS